MIVRCVEEFNPARVFGMLLVLIAVAAALLDHSPGHNLQMERQWLDSYSSINLLSVIETGVKPAPSGVGI